MTRQTLFTMVLFGSLVIGIFNFAPRVEAAGIAGIPYWGPIVSCTGDYAAVNSGSKTGVTTPCTSICDIFQTVQNAIKLALTIALLVLAPIFIVVGGLMMLTAGGSSDRFGKGTKVLSSTVIGIVMMLGAFVIVNVFFIILGSNSSGMNVTWSNIKCNVQPYNPK